LFEKDQIEHLVADEGGKPMQSALSANGFDEKSMTSSEHCTKGATLSTSLVLNKEDKPKKKSKLRSLSFLKGLKKNNTIS
jgi:hypothetical protein